ncbi:MAG: outer membrane beta-barrel protein [Chlorobiota bacterium]|nr:MAG: outer membrane beta-barrel protein [Chlorobiota bacterium]
MFPKLWLDAGFFKAHLGTESILPKENFTISSAVGSFYEASIESGFRLNYNPIQELSINFYLLNGYNLFIDNNTKKSFGSLVTYNFNDNSIISYSNYIGDDTPSSGDSISHLLLQQNLYFNSQVGNLKYQIGFDYAIKQNSDVSNLKQSASMISGILGLKYIFNDNYSLYGRGEYFEDPNGILSGVIIDSKNKSTGFKLFGLTAGVEYKPTDNSYLRIEGRQLIMDSDQKIFRVKNPLTNSRFEVLSNLGISF